jgi:hypothetical protein
MSMHVCKLDPGAHVFNAFEFAFKFSCDTVASNVKDVHTVWPMRI